MLNSIVDTDNTNPQLKEKVKLVVEDMLWELERIIAYGIRRQEFKADIEPDKTAVIIFTFIEGGIAITRSQSDGKIMDVVADQLLRYLEDELVR